jgi:hypothetical protein
VISLGYHVYAAAFAAEEQRQEIVDRVNAIDGLNLVVTTLQGDIRLPLEFLADEGRHQAFLAIVAWTIDRFRRTAEV